MNNLLKHWFTAFLRGRRATLHFGRRALLETLGERGRAGAVPDKLNRDLLRASGDDLAAAMIRLESNAEGLASIDVAERLARIGPNEVASEKPLPWWLHLWHCYKNPFNLLLTLLAVVSYLTEDVKATVVIGTMVALSTIIRFVQEGKSTRAAERLKAMVSNTATVIRRRDGSKAMEDAAIAFSGSSEISGLSFRAEVPIRELVPGDHVVLSAGDMIPADCRVMTAKDLFVAQAAMTGESLSTCRWGHSQSTSSSRHCRFRSSFIW